jgi:hypothetical protein
MGIWHGGFLGRMHLSHKQLGCAKIALYDPAIELLFYILIIIWVSRG